MFGMALTRPTTVIDSAIDEWNGRLRACVQAKSGHFEQLL